MKNRKIVFAISPHGYGHASQTSSVVNALLRQFPETEIWLKTPLPKEFLQQRFAASVHVYPGLIDFGMVMASSIDVLAQASWQRYKALHDDWEVSVGQEMEDLRKIQPDLVVSNVAYTTLEAARRLGIPSIAMCSLNWADIFAHYCHAYPGSAKIIEQIQAAYNSAQLFIQLTPCPPMPWIANKRAVSPVTRLGINRREELNAKFNWSTRTQLILIGLGGIEMRLPIEDWPKRENTIWLIPDEWQTARQDCVSLAETNLNFIDLLCSANALMTKPGYGTFSEAVCNQIPFLYVPRGDWPEEPFLVEWAQRCGHANSVTREALFSGSFYRQLDDLLVAARQRKPSPSASGAEEAAAIIMKHG